MSHLPPSADNTANSGLTTPDGLFSVERGAKLDMEDETRQGPARPDAGGTDVDGGASSSEDMKGSSSGRKGKEPANMTSPSFCTHCNDCLAQPTTLAPVCSVDCDRDQARLDGSRHVAASGARAKTASLMDIDESGLARMAQAEDAPVPDAEYYIESADCTIRVEDTLFRVSPHSQLIARAHRSRHHDMAWDRPPRLDVALVRAAFAYPTLQGCGTLESG